MASTRLNGDDTRSGGRRHELAVIGDHLVGADAERDSQVQGDVGPLRSSMSDCK
jgi:hypothetical protein